MALSIHFQRIRVRVVAVFAVIGCVLLTSARGQAADWPQFRGPGGQGVSSEKGLPATWGEHENLVWKAELPGPGTSSPIFFGNRIFLTSYSGFNVPGERGGDMSQLKRHMVCLDRKTGKKLWDTAVPAKLPEQETIRDGHGYASSTPVADAQRVYAFFGKSGVYAFDHSGKQIWQTGVGSNLHGWGSAASPILYNDLLIVNASVESESLYALNRATGVVVWRTGGIKESWNTPIVVRPRGGNPELVVAIMGKILGFDPATGKELWSCKTDIGWYMVPSLVVEGDVIYCIGGRSGGALAVRAGGRGDVTGTHRLWTGNKGSNVSSPIVHKGHLYWMHENQGLVFCAEAKTGKIVYQQRVDRADQVYASPLLADGRLHYLTRGGKTFVIAARPEYELIATNDLRDGSVFNASPVAIDGRLFIRSDKYLYCFDDR